MIVVRGDLLAAASVIEGRLYILQFLLCGMQLYLKSLYLILIRVVFRTQRRCIFDACLADLPEKVSVSRLKGKDL